MAFVNNIEEADIDAPLPGENGPYLQAHAVYERERQDYLEQYGIAPLQARWEARIREAMEHPGEDPSGTFR